MSGGGFSVEHHSDLSAKTSRRCVYTALIGGYETLNEQPVASSSDLSFICLTDNPELRSESWKIVLVKPIFAMDPIRSQRHFKLLPHVYLADMDISMYIDNSVILNEPPELIFEKHFTKGDFSIASHSYRASVLDEFMEVSRLGLDD